MILCDFALSPFVFVGLARDDGDFARFCEAGLVDLLEDLGLALDDGDFLRFCEAGLVDLLVDPLEDLLQDLLEDLIESPS